MISAQWTFEKGGRDFALPIMIIQGAEDYDTPVELARAYFNSVSAPQKKFVTLDAAGHTARLQLHRIPCRA